MDQQTHDATLAVFRQEVESGKAFWHHYRSHAGRRVGGPPVPREAWAESVGWLARLAAVDDAMAQLVASIGLPPLYQTDGEAAAFLYLKAFDRLRTPYDDVIGRSLPDAGRPGQYRRDWTLRERITALAYLKRAADPFNDTVGGYGWALSDLAAAESVSLPPWK